jgi:threonine dehydrogenase-like Zn-dependent dehydrogenase
LKAHKYRNGINVYHQGGYDPDAEGGAGGAGCTVVMAGANLVRMRVDLSPVWYKEVNLIGVLIHGVEDWNGARRSTYDLTCELLLDGKLTAAGLITHYFRLEDWKEAIKTAQDKRSGSIKVVFDYREHTPG